MFKTLFNSRAFLLFVLILAFALRLHALSTPAQPYDIGTYQAWGNHLLSIGPLTFFSTIWSDYLPLPILTFALPSTLSQLLPLSFTVLFKAFNTLLELGLIFALTRATPRSLRPVTLALLLLSPATIGNTSYWGQVDALPSLTSALALLLLTRATPSSNSRFLSALLYGLAVAYKPIMLLLAPVFWLLSVQKNYFWKFPLFSGLTFFLTALPFVSRPWEVFSFLWERALDQAGTYPYLSINAWNLWTLTANPAWIPDNTSVLGLSGRTLGLALFALVTTLTLRQWYRHRLSPAHAPLVSSLILIAFYTVTTRMHERHLLFGLPFLALSLLSFPSRFRTLLYLGLNAFYVLNLYSAFSWVLNDQRWPLPPLVTSLSSWGTVLSLLFLLLHYLYPNMFLTLTQFLKRHALLTLITLLALALRLVNLGHPPAYIFDEVYHAFTAKEYLHNHVEAWEWWTTPPEGVAYEWTHPPVAKYGMVLGMLLFQESEFGYRLGSAVMGVLAIPTLYFLVRALTKNTSLALLSAFLLTIEGTHLAQSRIAMNDSYLLTFYLWALYAAVKSRWRLAGIFYGLALGSKWSALYGLLPLAFLYVRQFLPLARANPRLFVVKLLLSLRLLAIALFVYVLTFTPFILAGHTWAQWWELHRQMWYYHTNLVATHAYQSTPLQWIFSARPVWYWVNYGAGEISHIFVQGNPLILWLGLVALLLLLPLVNTYPTSLFYLLYLIFVVPWIFSPRIMFYYHYLPSAVFLLPLLSTWLITLPRKLIYVVLVLCALSLLLVSPMLYGFPLPTTYWDTFFTLFPTWK